ncbi:OmpA family protein [Paraburkholderia sp. C35]|uniref:OmpA family protein n=1 Tax=Paraburkholderia sp. C35 TaxID=2126993 RepID=UPI000D68D86D|nr:OmpA family protein [Paraburkholderia sp. C35]
MSGSIDSFLSGRAARGACLIALGVLACQGIARAEDPVVKEQDIDENSVTKALTPDDNGDNIVTRGFVLSNKAGAAAKPAAPAKAASLNMLITFTTNSSTLTDTAQAALDKVAHALQSDRLAAYRFRVEGHADPRGAADANMKLSEDRAAAVVAYLTQKDGIAAERLTSVGKGSTEPLNRRNPTAPENRRVTIVTVTN